MTEVCSGRLEYKQYWINDNKWGNPNATQCIYENNGVLGWRWTNSRGLTYPSIVVGTNFCLWNSLWNKFPIKWNDISSWIVDVTWNYPMHPTGWWNLSFDIYFTDTTCNPPTGYSDARKKYNPMIWLQGYEAHTGPTVTDGINTYHVQNLRNEVWPRRLFMLDNPPSGGGSIKIDIKKLINTLPTIVKQDGTTYTLDGNWVVDGIHFGNETSCGTSCFLGTSVGQTNITKYDMEINGSTISLGGTGNNYGCSGAQCLPGYGSLPSGCNNTCGGGGGDGVGSWFQRTTCFTPTLCFPNKYIAVGTGVMLLALMKRNRKIKKKRNKGKL